MRQAYKTYSLFLLTVLAILSGCRSGDSAADFSAIEHGFLSPDTVQTSVYWYWMNDDISKEGVIKDLQAMKEAGINRAYIGNIGMGPYGSVKLFSDEWWDVLHAALKTATELNIEIGIFNSPGWSQSGGPWIKPEQSMRYLASSELRVKGPQKFSGKLNQPTTDFQDVKVLAWPAPATIDSNLLTITGAQITFSDPKIRVPQPSKSSAQFAFPAGESFIGIKLPKPAVARSLIIDPMTIEADCELQAKDGSEFKTIRTFKVNRTNFALNVGFNPYAPVAVSFPETSASEFRLVFRNARAGDEIKDICLSPAPIVERYAEKSLAKMFQTPLPYWADYLWDKQPEIKDLSLLTDTSKVQDITSFLASDGTLIWDVPAGDWIIMRTGMAPTKVTNAPASPEGTGLEVDKMSKQHVQEHFDAFLGEIIKRIPAEDRKTWKVVVEDSYETGGQNFTDNFLDEFRKCYGYDPTPFLPVFQGYVIGNPDLSDRFLWDVRRMVADKVSYDYVGGLREISNKHGLRTWLENYGHWGFPGEFLQYGGQSDEVGGEFWSEGDLGNIENRAASSCAHIYGKKKVWAESFTCGGPTFTRYPALMKRRGDWSFTEGINSTLLHVCIHQPYEDRDPGVNAWFGNEFNRKNTWFKQLDLFTTYLKRCNFMLQQGQNVADVAYFIGEDAPKMTGIREPELPKGYSFDYINAEVILRDLSVKDGRLVLPHGTSYRLLVLPPLETMRPELLQKIERLVANGAVILGPPPSRSPSMQNYPACDNKVQVLAGKIWGDSLVKQRSYGKGMVLTHMNMQEVLGLLKIVPDCKFAEKDPALYVHRTFGNGNIYFVTNQSDGQIRINPEFRVKSMQPELWDAVTATIRPLSAFEQKGETTIVPLQLEANGSAFIVFRKKGAPSATSVEANFPQPEVISEITTPWKVYFESDKIKRGPSEPVVFDRLQDWSQHPDERIRYYSGTAVYKNTLTINQLKKGPQLCLDLGQVNVMAKIKINGTYIGGVWTPPYRLDISDYVKQGDNELEIEVVNTWVNRLIGDQHLSPENRPTQLTVNLFNAESPLQPSGLIGPVKIMQFIFN